MIHRDPCAGKQPYGSPDEADAARRALWRKLGQSLRVYHCKKCNQWLLGGSPGRRRR